MSGQHQYYLLVVIRKIEEDERLKKRKNFTKEEFQYHIILVATEGVAGVDEYAETSEDVVPVDATVNPNLGILTPEEGGGGGGGGIELPVDGGGTELEAAPPDGTTTKI